MADYSGYGYRGFASGLQSGLSLGMERYRIKSLAEEKKALEKAKEEEKLAMNTWLADNRESIENYSNLSQEEKNWLIASSFQYSEKMAGFFNDWDKSIKEGNVEEAKNKQKQWEDILATKKDLSLAGVGLSEGFFIDGAKYDPNKPLIPPKDTEYLRKVEIGKFAGGDTASAIARETWKGQGYGELPTETAKPTDTQVKLAEVDKLGFLTEERRNAMKVNILAGGDSATAEKVNAIRAANGTDADILEAFGAGVQGVNPPTTTIRVTSLPQLEKYRDKALNAESLEDMQSVIDDYKEAGYDPAPLEEKVNEQAWANNQTEYLSNLLNAIKATVNEKGWLKSGEVTPQEVSNQIKKNAPASEVYEDFRKEYMKYRDILEKAGVDVSQFPKLKPLSEIEKVGFLEGVKTFGGVGKGQYKSIYY